MLLPERKNAALETERAVADLLEGRAEVLSFSKLLESVYSGREPAGVRLTERLTEYDAGEGREKTARKVRNWMHDRNLPKNREEVFKICFALDLDEGQAEKVLGMTAESGIHYRNPGELVYAFCLRKGIDYLKAVEMKERIFRDIFGEAGLPPEDLSSGIRPLNLTGYVRKRFQRVTTEEELRRFLESSKEKFGYYHNTAYRKFCRMLNCLIQPEAAGSGMPRDENYSIRKAVEDYLRMGIPYDRKLGRYSRLQREIKHHWPSAKSIYEMYARKTDVDRKTLLLLYIATEGETELRENIQGNEEAHRRRMDLMMAECGMPGLNENCPFDYLVLKAVSGADEEEFIGNRMEQMIRKVFGREKPICTAVREQTEE